MSDIINHGTVFGVGVGPGDPDLITLKAIKILSQVSFIFTAASSDKEYSRAHDVVKPYLNGKSLIRLNFLMRENKTLQNEIWRHNALTILEKVNQGHDVAFITMGNPLTYSTWGYIIRQIKTLSPHTKLVTIPGITSYNAVSAVLNLILTEANESFALVSGLDLEKLENTLKIADTIAIMKVNRNFTKITALLEKHNLLDKAVLGVQIGMEGEVIFPSLKEVDNENLPYFSIIIVKKLQDNVKKKD